MRSDTCRLAERAYAVGLGDGLAEGLGEGLVDGLGDGEVDSVGVGAGESVGSGVDSAAGDSSVDAGSVLVLVVVLTPALFLAVRDELRGDYREELTHD